MYLEYPGTVRAIFHLWLAVAPAVSLESALAQDPPASDAAQQADFFSGFIVSANSTQITVNRKGLGKDTAATRTFVIDAATKIEGVLKPKAHVTVRFSVEENTARAVHILVR